jgi:DNA-binding NtrC family response regulator
MDKSISLLIVDDEVPFLNSIAARLELRGFDVRKAVNGEQAAEAARSSRFDLALIDLKMPGMNGRQLLEILKREHRFLEVIVLTGHGSLESAVECTKLGAFGYLPKPYEFDRLIEVLRDAYRARLEKKFDNDRAQMEKILQAAQGDSALGIMRKLRAIDDDMK